MFQMFGNADTHFVDLLSQLPEIGTKFVNVDGVVKHRLTYHSGRSQKYADVHSCGRCFASDLSHKVSVARNFIIAFLFIISHVCMIWIYLYNVYRRKPTEFRDTKSMLAKIKRNSPELKVVFVLSGWKNILTSWNPRKYVITIEYPRKMKLRRQIQPLELHFLCLDKESDSIFIINDVSIYRQVTAKSSVLLSETYLKAVRKRKMTS